MGGVAEHEGQRHPVLRGVSYREGGASGTCPDELLKWAWQDARDLQPGGQALGAAAVGLRRGPPRWQMSPLTPLPCCPWWGQRSPQGFPVG